MTVFRLCKTEPVTYENPGWPYRSALDHCVAASSGLVSRMPDTFAVPHGLLDIRREGDAIVIDTRSGQVALTPQTAIAIADFIRGAAEDLRSEIEDRDK